ncbi:hypothetical protein YIM73518_19630 [Thermus brockianus]|uniref:Uncharacterized protein n=1 Tax=Thermus brockianus TaxID=56956 RepID=A0ABN6NIS0_THEBO|nr:hypothetical protein TbrSNM41_22250 [Thermus brockianus]
MGHPVGIPEKDPIPLQEGPYPLPRRVGQAGKLLASLQHQDVPRAGEKAPARLPMECLPVLHRAGEAAPFVPKVPVQEDHLPPGQEGQVGTLRGLHHVVVVGVGEPQGLRLEGRLRVQGLLIKTEGQGIPLGKGQEPTPQGVGLRAVADVPLPP